MDQVGEDALVTCNNVLNRLVAAETHVVGVAACLFKRRSGIRSKEWARAWEESRSRSKQERKWNIGKKNGREEVIWASRGCRVGKKIAK